MKKPINKRTLKKIKKHLPDGWKDAIAEELNLKPETIRKVLGGLRNNNAVVSMAVDLSSLPASEKSEILSKIL